MPRVAVEERFVTGRAIMPLYGGRSPQFAGVDQINRSAKRYRTSSCSTRLLRCCPKPALCSAASRSEWIACSGTRGGDWQGAGRAADLGIGRESGTEIPEAGEGTQRRGEKACEVVTSSASQGALLSDGAPHVPEPCRGWDWARLTWTTRWRLVGILMSANSEFTRRARLYGPGSQVF
jgi:hypothetical protein